MKINKFEPSTFESNNLLKTDKEDEQTIFKLFEDNSDLKSNFSDKFRNDPWIQTFSGQKFNLLEPDPNSINLEDIAHALSLQCRFTGHCNFHYSIAFHSVLVSYLCDSQDAKYGLFHDASEAYISDISSPLKKTSALEGYRKVEGNIQNTIYRKFGLNKTEPLSVKKADILLLNIEVNSLFNGKHPDWKYSGVIPPISIQEISPIQAEKLFLDRYKELYAKDS